MGKNPYGMHGAPAVKKGLGGLPRRSESGSCKSLDVAIGSANTLANLLPNFALANTTVPVANIDPALLTLFPVQLNVTLSTTALPNAAYSETVVTDAGVMVHVRGTGVYTSTDGITWTNTATLPQSNSGQPVITDGTTVIIFCANSTTTYSYRSTDLVNWTANATFSGEASCSSACFGNGKIICTVGAYGTASQSVKVSTNLGVSWSSYTLPISDWWCGCAFANNMFMVAVVTGTHSKTACATSPDGVTWTIRSLPSPGAFASLKALNGKFTICGGDSDAFSTSQDGITWSNNVILPNPSAREWGQISYGNHAYAVVQKSTISTAIATSFDGINWFETTVASHYGGFITHIGSGVFFVTPQSSSYNPSKITVASVDQGLVLLNGTANTYIKIRK